LLAGLLALLAPLVQSPAAADEASIRRNLAARLPELQKIDEVRPSAMPGLWEVRLGTEVIYSDADGSFVLEGALIDTRRQVDLTEARETALKAFDYATLPLRDTVTWSRGTGARHIVVFADPNCAYCRKFERLLSDVPNVTVHTFVIPILGEDSVAKAHAIWCAPAAQRGQVWRRWMVDGVVPPATAACDTAALERNLELQRRHGVVGTPSLVFRDGERVAGVMTIAALESKFASLSQRR
jgi:thiol:disulfide interchange protein DsbC